MPATSEPPPGSVTASAPIFSPASVGRTNASICSRRAVRRHVRQGDPAGEQPGGQAGGPTGLEERLLHRHRVEQRAALAADLLGEGDAEQPRLRGGQVQRPRDLAGVLPLLEVRLDLPAYELAGASPAAPAARRSRSWPSPRSQQLLRDVTSRERSHSPRPLACGSNRVLAATPSPSSPWISTFTPCRLGSAKTSTSRSAASGTQLADPVDGDEVRAATAPARPARSPARTQRPTLASPPLSPERACTNVPSGTSRVIASSRTPAICGATVWSSLVCTAGCSRDRRVRDHLGAAVGQVHGVLDDVAVDVRRPVDAVRRGRPGRRRHREAGVGPQRQLDRRAGERLADDSPRSRP